MNAMRLGGLIRKEVLQILRDPSSIAIAFVLPLVLLLLFGYGISLDAREVPIGIVIEEPSVAASSFAGSFLHSPYFHPVLFRHRQPAEAALVRGELDAMVVLRQDFARRARRPQGAPVQVVVDGTDANTARLVTGYAAGAWQTWLGHEARLRGRPLPPPAVLEHRIWFNAAVRSRNFLIPGLIAIIMTLIGALLTALVVAREWERGTMEALLVTRVTRFELLVGKLAPYFVLGMGGMALSVAMAVFLFGVPFRGSVGVLVAASALFLLAALGMGLLISTVARNQFVAGQIAIITAFLPAFILSGFIFDIASMPQPIQAITYLISARYFVAALQSLFLAGDVWSVLVPNLAALALIGIVFLGLTWRRTRTRLE